MNIQFESFSAFLDMGGYGFYVWLAYGVSFSAYAVLLWHSFTHRKRNIKQIAEKLKREERLKQHREQQ